MEKNPVYTHWYKTVVKKKNYQYFLYIALIANNTIYFERFGELNIRPNKNLFHFLLDIFRNVLILGNNARATIKLSVIYKWTGGFAPSLSSDLHGGDIRLVIFHAFRVHFHRTLPTPSSTPKEHLDMEFFL